MDSVSSSSMQSSSGGDDDVGSKAESSMSMTMSTTTTMHVPMPLVLDHHHSPSLPNYYNLNNTFLPSSLMFDPDYLPRSSFSSQTQQQPQQDPDLISHLHIDAFHPGPSCTGQGGLPVSSSLSPRQTVLFSQGLTQVQQYPPSSTPTRNKPKKASRNPRKRTRASRKAPTTVLSIDTSNFRAMVQEFTGFPTPPFCGSRKLDLFGSGSIFRSSNHGQDPLSRMFPLRPSAQRFQQPPLMGNSSHATSNANPSCIINNALMSTITSSVAQTATAARPNNADAAPPLNLPTHPSGDHQNSTTLPGSSYILTAFPLLTNSQNPLDTASSLQLFEANSNMYFQDRLGPRWDPGLQARGIGTIDTDTGNDHSRPSNNKDHGGTRRLRSISSHNDKGREDMAGGNSFGPSD